ncbi:Uncharacterised protein [Mycobacteroides abscessus subsp. bolletii]|nr:hypothetical protein [Mycobacteroides abscessus]SKX80343.1 Uncharacterised protein [Mycobacteroides abscessus subsp. bolletii]
MIEAFIDWYQRRKTVRFIEAQRHIAWAESLRDPDAPIPYALVDVRADAA